MRNHLYARVAELADAQDLGSCVLGRGGSSPPSRTVAPRSVTWGFLCRAGLCREVTYAREWRRCCGHACGEVADTQDLGSCV